jgi:hypothetical protein
VVCIGFVASLVSAAGRWRTETRNREVEIALDYSELRSMAAAGATANGQPVPFAGVLADFRAAGATSVAVEEDTIGGLEQSRRLTILPGTDRNATVLRPLSADSYNRIVDALQNKTRFVLEPSSTGPSDILVRQPITVVRAVGVGIDAGVANVIRRAHLRMLGRVGNFAGASPRAIDWTLDNLRASGASTLVFTGEEVLGFAGPLATGQSNPNLAVMKAGLDRDNLNYGTVEFGKQKGDIEMQRKAPDRVVRVHTILGTEMATADVPSNVQRFLLAARERNIRVLFVRLFPSEPDALNANIDYVRQIRDGLSHARLTHLLPGVAHGYSDLHTSRFLRALIGLGVAAGWLLLVDSITRVLTGEIGRAALWATAIIGLMLVALSLLNSFEGAKLVALAAACLFPSLALLHNDQLRSESGSGFNPLVIAVARFLTACAITFVGIAAVVGLLADRLFLLKTDLFIGVKAAAIVPALLVAAVYGLGLRAGSRRPWRVAVAEAQASLNRLASQPINLAQIAVSVFALALLALIVMRSGNDPGVGVSAFELKTRGLLDAIMPARPRFKEFLLGHPALILAFVLAARGYRRAALPLLILGAIGQASLLDTFCHLHTPLPVSLSRALIAIVIGLVFGSGIYALLLRPLLRRLPPAPAAI